jgi:hypothetical protein
MSQTKRNPDSVNKWLKLVSFRKKAISKHINGFAETSFLPDILRLRLEHIRF